MTSGDGLLIENGKRGMEWMKWTVFLITGLAVFAGSGSSSPAEVVPQRAAVIWNTAECGKEGLTLLVNSRIALMVEWEGLATSVAVVPAEWVGESIMLRVKGEAHERVLHLDDLKQCDDLPGSMSLLFTDVIAVFDGLDDLVALCRGLAEVTASCAAAVADLVDRTNDGVFSHDELRQAMRVASFFIAYRGITVGQGKAFVTLEQLLVAQLAASVMGPIVVTRLIDLYDANGDGVLSPEELMKGQDPEQAVQRILANLVAKTPPPVAAMLMKSIPGFQLPAEGD